MRITFDDPSSTSNERTGYVRINTDYTPACHQCGEREGTIEGICSKCLHENMEKIE